MNSRLSQVAQSVTIQIADTIRDLERRGERVIKLQTGDPDFATPSAVIEAAHQAMLQGFTHYTTSRGLPELRQALAEKLAHENGVVVNPSTDILVTHGAAHAIFITLQTLLEPGDEVLLIEPYYMSYASSVRLAGGIPVTVPTEPGHAFALDCERLRAHITPRSRLLIINSPSNPAGVVLSRSDVEALAQIALEHNLYIVCDDVYEKLIYDGSEHVTVASLPDVRERTITINSFSKTYAMTGWRLGYLAAQANLVEQMLKVLQYSATSIAPFSQKAALVALTASEVSDAVTMMQQRYAERRRAGLAAIAEIAGLRALEPQGAFYLMLDISAFCQDSVAFTYRLLEKAYVGVVPGVAFGASAEGWIRLTFAVADEILLEGIQRIGHVLHSEYGA